jgi:membrane protease YdiL (CAAX protease family)
VSGVPPTLADTRPGSPGQPSGAASAPPRWPPWTAPVSLLATFALTLAASPIVYVIVALAGESTEDPPPWTDIVSTLIQDVALVVSALIFARMTQRPRPADFGVRPTRLWPALGWAAATWLSFFATLAVLRAVLQVGGDPQSAFDKLAHEKGTLTVASLCVLVTVAAPIAEEIFFRGYFFTALRNWRGVGVAAAITGVTFGAVHISSYVDHFNAVAAIAVAGLMVFGGALCLLYWHTGSLLPCFAVHALNNSLAFGALEHWRWWQVIALMVGANLVIAAIVLPVARRRPGALAPA